VTLLSRNWRILGSLLAAAALVGGSYLVAANGALEPTRVEASTETALLQAIATKDSDGDGLPDWEETLYGTDPHLVDTRTLGMTDGEAVTKGLIVPSAVADIPAPEAGGGTAPVTVDGVAAPAPGSLTANFAKTFFSLYLSAKQAKGGLLSQEESAALVQKAVDQLAASIAPTSDFKTLGELTVSGTGPDALRAFAISAETVMTQHSVQASKSELLYLEDAVKNGDSSALTHIMAIAKGYRESATALAVLPVPQELANDYLTLINALARIAQISGDFARVEGDPLATMLALGQYPQTVLALGNSLININKTYVASGVLLPSGTPGASFVNIIPTIAENQKAAASKHP